MKRIPDEQQLVEELRELPDFSVRAEKREQMRAVIEYGVVRRRRAQKLKVAFGSVAGVAAAVVVAVVMVNHFGTGVGSNTVPGGSGTTAHSSPQMAHHEQQTVVQYVNHLRFKVVSTPPTAKVTQDGLYAEVAALTQRLDAGGIPSPQVLIDQKTNDILVALPKVDDLQAVKQVILQPVSLEFKDEKEMLLANGKDLKQNAQVVVDPQTGQTQVSIEFRDPKLFEAITLANIGRRLTIWENGQALAAPTISTVIKDGKCVISGNFTQKSAASLVDQLNAVTLPYQLVEVQS